MPKRSTLVVFTTSGPTPSYLYRLQHADLIATWIGQHGKFVNMQTPSTNFPWSHVMLVEGDLIRRGPKWLAADDWVEFPGSLLPLQSWSFTIEEDARLDIFSQHVNGRFCVWNFITFPNEETEKNYREYLASEGVSKKRHAMNMGLHFGGRIISTEESLATQANKLNKRSPVKSSDTSKGNPLELSQKARRRSRAKTGDLINFVIQMSFPSRNEWEYYLGWDERKEFQKQGVTEGFIECTQTDLPPKGADYGQFREYGHELEPFGQDWFG